MVRFTINNLTAKLSGDLELLNKLYKELRFKHPKAYYILQKVRYDWDGYVNPLTDKGTLKTGLLSQAIAYLSKFEDDYEVVDHRKIPTLLGIPNKVGPLELRQYQKECIEALVYNEFLGMPHPRGIAAAAVNAGKTPIMFGIHVAYENARTLILLNSKVLYAQMIDDLKLIFPDTYGYMQGQSLKWGEIMVVMAPTLANRLTLFKKELQAYNILLTDECDLADNDTYAQVFNGLSHISVRFGFTGTIFLRNLKKDRLRNIKMKEIFGESLYTIDPITLEKLDVSTKTRIKIVRGNVRYWEADSFLEEWEECITNNKRRMGIIARRLWLNRKWGRKHVMVFCRYINQTELTYEFLHQGFPKWKIEYTHHERENQAQIIKDFKEGKIEVLVTSLYLKRGMNFPLVNLIINASGGEWYSNPLQITGRGVRKHEGKDEFVLEDIYDEGKYLSKHSKQRVKYYAKVGYTPTFVD